LTVFSCFAETNEYLKRTQSGVALLKAQAELDALKALKGAARGGGGGGGGGAGGGGFCGRGTLAGVEPVGAARTRPWNAPPPSAPELTSWPPRAPTRHGHRLGRRYRPVHTRAKAFEASSA
jgi:hypothetical protein